MSKIDVAASASHTVASRPPVAFPACAAKSHSSFRACILAACAILLLPLNSFAQTSAYVQTNLISDGAVPAKQTDPTLINPWGVSIGTDWWIDSPGSGFSLVEDNSFNKSFAVAVPGAASAQAHGSPAGTVFNSDSTLFNIPGNGSALFLFGNLDGSIAAWNASTPEAVTVVNNSTAKAVYTDIALDKNATGTFLLAANFAGGTVDVFDSKFASAHLAGAFTDPAMPKGFAPFGIHSIGGNVYVTYAQVDPTSGLEVVGAGLGYVDLFDGNGNLMQRAISQGSLNAPWGMALAPSGFGSYGGDLLVGNFGDGTINVYDPVSFALKGQLQDATGAPIVNTGLWEIVFGTNGVGDPNTLYFAAGINGEKDGLFGSIAVAPPATGTPDFSFQATTKTVSIAAGQTGTVALSLTAANGFSGPVSLSCSGLPTGDSCTFSPSAINLSGSTATSVMVSIGTAAAAAPPPVTSPYIANKMLHSRSGMTLALLGPFGVLALFGVRRKSAMLRGSVLLMMVALFTLSTVGCSSSPKAQQPPSNSSSTAPVTSQVTINATSGAITHSVTVALTVQ
jgi:uncharacterized protein (TIGR03118 family)